MTNAQKLLKTFTKKNIDVIFFIKSNKSIKYIFSKKFKKPNSIEELEKVLQYCKNESKICQNLLRYRKKTIEKIGVDTNIKTINNDYKEIIYFIKHLPKNININ